MDIFQAIEERGLAHREFFKEATLSGDSEVQKFYDDAVVFITGASGFIGKQLVEKLIRSANIRKIYLLLRPKKGDNIHQRLKKILEDPVYIDLHNDKASFVDNIVPIEGDVSVINLGIDEKSWSILTDEINVIIHTAATVNFAEPIKKATLTNVRGTREVLKLARACKNLKSIVHVSTAYVHATRSRMKQEVKEDFYDSPISPNALIELSESLDEYTLNNIITPLMQEWPNTYTFTKAVTEELIRSQAGGLPICIIRPAIVISAYTEPRPGWVDIRNALGPSGIIVGLGLGVIHTIHTDLSINFDLVPVDFVNNAILVAAWKTFVRYTEGEHKAIIYTISGARNPLKNREFSYILNNEGLKIVFSKAVWYCFSIETKHKFIFNILMVLFHFIPALAVDGCCLLIEQKPRLFKICKKVASRASVFVYFNTNEWFFDDTNTHKLHSQLSKTDKLLYNFDMSSVNMKEVVMAWIYGVRKYIVKDNMDGESVDYARKKQFWFKVAHYVIFPIYMYSLFKIVRITFVFIYKILRLLGL